MMAPDMETHESPSRIVDERAASKPSSRRAQQLLLQLHGAFLLRATIADLTFRAIAVATTTLAIVGPRLFPTAQPVAISTTIVGVLVGILWWNQQRQLATHIARVEKLLGKKNSLEFDTTYINYRFEARTDNIEFQVLRYEPILWPGVILISALTALFF
jgi:hypothetical protein